VIPEFMNQILNINNRHVMSTAVHPRRRKLKLIEKLLVAILGVLILSKTIEWKNYKEANPPSQIRLHGGILKYFPGIWGNHR